jgi:hypothetical protein
MWVPMSKAFKHPLARKATTATLRRGGGAEESVLVVVTTLELDAAAKGFNRKHVDRLNEAAAEFVAEHKGVAGFVLINRPKEWDA